MTQIQAVKSGVGTRSLVKYIGLSTEPKPMLTPELSGSTLYLVDTGQTFTWYNINWFEEA